MVVPMREQLQKYHYTGALHWKETLLQLLDRVIDDNLKRQIKNQTLCTI